VDSGKVREQGHSLNQIFRENLKYILAVLFVWAITFPMVLQDKDDILARFNIWYNDLFLSYPDRLRIAHKFIQKGDEIIQGRKELSSNPFSKITAFFSGEDLNKAITLPLDLTLMEKACLYYRSKEHIEEIFLEPTWREKAQEWNSPLFLKSKSSDSLDVALGPNPKEYWNSHHEAVLEALDYYKRALRFSGPEFQAPKKIESVSWAVCRPAEILLAYKTYMLETEKYVLDILKKEEKDPSRRTETQILTQVLQSIKSGKIPGVDPNDYKEALLRQILLTGMKDFSPREMGSVYFRIIYLSASNEPEYLKFVQRRGELFFQLGKENPEFYKNAIQDFKTSMDISIAVKDESANFPLLLVHQFEAKLSIVKCYVELAEYNTALKLLDELIPSLRNVDERSVGGIKSPILKSYRETKRFVLRRKGRFDEADEIPFDE
jgi:hypothetical protein